MNEHLPGTEVVDSGTTSGIRWWVTRMDRIGLPKDIQYNGYIELPADHPIMIIGASYSVADRYLDAHRGITYLNGNVVGFDTNHYGDSETVWPLERVREHTTNLAREVDATNTPEKQAEARHVKELRARITTAAEELEALGFTTYDLNLYF